MKLNLSDEPITAELLAESLQRTSSAIIAVNGNSMYPTLQMGWRVHLEPSRGEDLRIGEIAVFRGEHYLTIHRLIWRENESGVDRLVFRGDYNRVRERVEPSSVIGRVIAIEIPSQDHGVEKIVPIGADVLTHFYRLAHFLVRALRPILPKRTGTSPPGRMGRMARSLLRGAERTLSVFLPQRR